MFNIFELVEMIFSYLPFKDIVQAQRICREARKVVVNTPRFSNGLMLYEPRVWLAAPPFRQMIDFCIPPSATDGETYLYLLGNHPYCHFDAGGDEAGMMRLYFDLSHEPHQDWDVDAEGYITCDRTIICPIPYRGPEDKPSLPPYESLQPWRNVSWTIETLWGEEVYVEIILRSKCDKGHVTEDRMVLMPGATLGQTVEWMTYFIQRWPAKHCPGGEPQFCHRRKFHLEGDTLHARTTDGVEGKKVTDKPFV